MMLTLYSRIVLMDHNVRRVLDLLASQRRLPSFLLLGLFVALFLGLSSVPVELVADLAVFAFLRLRKIQMVRNVIDRVIHANFEGIAPNAAKVLAQVTILSFLLRILTCFLWKASRGSKRVPGGVRASS